MTRLTELARTRNTNPVQTLIHEISSRGWTVNTVKWDKAKDGFVAKAKNSHGEEVEKSAHDEGTALAALLQHIVRKEKTRQPKNSAWQTTWVDKLQEVADAYAKAPVFDPKAASAWKALADDSVVRASIIQQQLHVEFSNNPHPYSNFSDLVDDVYDKKHVNISRANSDSHPVWTSEQVIAFRLVHEIMGHVLQGADYSWEGENKAFAGHAELLTEETQKALFAETVAAAAYNTVFHYGGPQKICFLNDVFNEVADKENPDGHSGVHPDLTFAPTQIPKIAGLVQDPNYGYESGQAQLPNAAYLWQDDPLDFAKQQDLSRNLETKWWDAQTPEGDEDFERMKNAVKNAFMAALLSPKKSLRSNAIHRQDLEGIPLGATDPNTYYNRIEGRRVQWNVARGYHPDSHKPHFKEAQEYVRYFQAMHPEMPPLQAQQEAQWDLLNMQREEEERMLEKNPDLRGDIMEPKVFEAMKTRLRGILRPSQTQGADAPSATLAASSWGLRAPQIITGPGWTNSGYEAEGPRRPFIYHPGENKVWLGETGQLHNDVMDDFSRDADHPMPSRQGEMVWGGVFPARNEASFYGIGDSENYPHVLKAVADYAGVKPRKPVGPGPAIDELGDLDFDDVPPFPDRFSKFAQQNLFGDGSTSIEQDDTEKYPAFMYSHLVDISRIVPYLDVLTRAALEDIRNHDAKGWHFRNTVMSLEIPNIGPKIASLTWYFLAPMTSELASLDTHMNEILTGNKDAPSNRDYYKLERMLAASRDASGYGQMPLAQFQHAVWDQKRTGPGTHQDHSPLRVEDPVPHSNVDWNNVMNAGQMLRDEYVNPQWLVDTQPAQQRVADEYDQEISPWFTTKMVPKKQVPVNTNAPMIYQSGLSKDEFHFALGVPEDVIHKIHSWTHANLDLSDASEIVEPEDYHITVAYAEKGWKNPKAHAIARNFNLKGMKFESAGLDFFDSQQDDGAVVLRLDSPQWGDWADRLIDEFKQSGLDINEFDGGPKAHITLAYMPSKPRPKASLALSFRAVDSYVSKPRGLGRRAYIGFPRYAEEETLDAPCELHNWPGCPICSVDDAAKAQDSYPEHSPKYDPFSIHDDSWEKMKTEWYNTVKEPGTLDNPKDPFVDLKPGIRAGSAPYVTAHADYTQHVADTTSDIENAFNTPGSPTTQTAMQHTGQIPGDEQFLGPHEVHTLNPNSGVNESFFGTLPESGTDTFVKPEGRWHKDDLARERAAFALAQEMGVRTPHMVLRTVEIPKQVDGPMGTQEPRESGIRPAMVAPDIGGDSTMNQGYSDPEDVESMWPEEARRIALFDNVTGNVDRHMGNLQVGEDGSLYAIDHGAAFGQGGARPYGELAWANNIHQSPLTEEEIELLNRLQGFDLTPFGIGSEQPAMQSRIQYMLDNGIYP